MYIAAANTCVEYASTVSFKAATVPRAGLARQDDAFEDLFYHLLIRGVQHEHTSGRAQLPRRIAFTKDREEEGRDRVMLANLMDRIHQASAARFDDQLEPARFEVDDSKALELIQVADLFAGSLNRRLNTPGNGPKDTFASQFLTSVGMPDGPEEEEEAGDMTIHVAL